MNALAMFLVSLAATPARPTNPRAHGATGSHLLAFDGGEVHFVPVKGAPLVSVVAFVEGEDAHPGATVKLVSVEDARKLYARARELGAVKVSPARRAA